MSGRMAGRSPHQKKISEGGLSSAGFSLWNLVLARPKIHRLNRLRKKYLFCHSERSEESLFDGKYKKTKEREILRFAQNDKTAGFSAACEACATNCKFCMQKNEAGTARPGQAGTSGPEIVRGSYRCRPGERLGR